MEAYPQQMSELAQQVEQVEQPHWVRPSSVYHQSLQNPELVVGQHSIAAESEQQLGLPVRERELVRSKRQRQVYRLDSEYN